MKEASNTFIWPLGFSLAEMLAALTIASMVLVTVLGIYSRADRAAAAITRRVDNCRFPCEVLQRIAEDLDGIIAAGADIQVPVPKNKFDHGFASAQLTIIKSISDTQNKRRTFEQIIWQSSYDYDANSLVLYRSYSSDKDIDLHEDKLLDAKRENWEKELFIPICTGVTFFRVRGVKNGEPLDSWSSPVPAGIEVTISFAEPFVTLDNTLDVAEEEKFTRIIAVDRTRKIRFRIAQKQDAIKEDAIRQDETGQR